ncbi:MAG: hypothetical protein JSR46_10740, partial [Verrucomicrobia bacterium]|nr:hypothetical protein [Verrucomicrobiota bacterium]
NLSLNENKIWMSPGLFAAMTAVGYLKEEMPFGEKSHLLHKLLQESLPLLEQPGEYIITCAEELIRVFLLSKHQLTKRQVEEYQSRPKVMMQTGVVLGAPADSKAGKANSFPAFLKEFELAKLAFKSLADNPLLKAWEFTLASFSEINLDFCRWNLYSSLGFNSDDAGGIGHCLYQMISQKVEQANEHMREMQEEYNQVAVQMQYIEARFRSASTEKEINWLKMEHQSRQTELYHIEQVRSIAYEKATKTAGLYEFLMSQYDKLFYDYFQEVYDADLHDVASGPFDDSPAGFRLIYKYGRSNPSQWVRIYSLPDFIEALVSFFTLTEADLRVSTQVKGIEDELGLCITYLINHIRSDEFIESAFYRMAKAHGVPLVSDPLHNLDKIEKKPWVYTSGGSMSTLVSAYFRREEKPTEVARWVENETELLAFFIDTIKQLPQEMSGSYLKNRDRSMLIHSPTHAFLLKPGSFSQAWTSDMYTYSWIKQYYIEPRVRDIDAITIDEEIGQHLVDSLEKFVQRDYRPRFRQVFQKLPYSSSPGGFRTFLVNTIDGDRGLKTSRGPTLSVDEIDAVLYSHLPYTAKSDVRDLSLKAVSTVLADNPQFAAQSPEVVEAILRHLSYRGVVSAQELTNIVKAICCVVQRGTKSSKNLYKAILEELRSQKALFAAPLIFADSNWVKDYFAFVVNPATGQMELWSVDFYGTTGRQISYWKMWLNGSRKEPQWGIFNRPSEYA